MAIGKQGDKVTVNLDGRRAVLTVAECGPETLVPTRSLDLFTKGVWAIEMRDRERVAHEIAIDTLPRGLKWCAEYPRLMAMLKRLRIWRPVPMVVRDPEIVKGPSGYSVKFHPPHALK